MKKMISIAIVMGIVLTGCSNDKVEEVIKYDPSVSVPQTHEQLVEYIDSNIQSNNIYSIRYDKVTSEEIKDIVSFRIDEAKSGYQERISLRGERDGETYFPYVYIENADGKYGGYELEQPNLISTTPEIDEYFREKQDEMLMRVVNELKNPIWFEGQEKENSEFGRTFTQNKEFIIEGMTFDTCRFSLPVDKSDLTEEVTFPAITLSCSNANEEAAGANQGDSIRYTLGFNEITPGMESFLGE